MFKTKDIFELNHRVCLDLWRTAKVNEEPSFLAPRLIFPAKRDDQIRISEQESRVLYCGHLNRTNYYYSIETPTENGYGEKQNMSALSDLSIFTLNTTDFVGQDDNDCRFRREANVEFKAHNPAPAEIAKDIEKLLREDATGNWFHTLKNVDSGTLPSLFGKFREALNAFAVPQPPSNALTHEDIWLTPPFRENYDEVSVVFTFCVLEKDWACSKRFYARRVKHDPDTFKAEVEKFFDLKYSVAKGEIHVNDANGWKIHTPTEFDVPPVETLKLTVNVNSSTSPKAAVPRRQEVGLFPTPSSLVTHIMGFFSSKEALPAGEILYLHFILDSPGKNSASIHPSRDDEVYERLRLFKEGNEGRKIRIYPGSEREKFEEWYFEVEKVEE